MTSRKTPQSLDSRRFFSVIFCKTLFYFHAFVVEVDHEYTL
jgi:hypothetical protein